MIFDISFLIFTFFPFVENDDLIHVTNTEFFFVGVFI